MQLKSNKELYDLILGLAGTDSFESTEQAHVFAFANRRLQDAYKASDVWPRYIVVGEPRTVADYNVEYDQDGRHVFGAGTTAVNGLYTLNGTQNSAAAYSIFDTDGTTELYSIIYSSGTTWQIIAGAPSSGGAVQYANTDASNTSTASSPVIAETGWTVSSGTSPAPRVRDLAHMEEILKVHRTQPFRRDSAEEYDFYCDPIGVHILNSVSDTESKVWITYKKAVTLLTDLDENTSSSLEEVPLEFFYYIAHAAYADFLRMDEQNDKAVMEENMANKFLDPEIRRAEQLMNANMIKTRYRTHLSTQNR